MKNVARATAARLTADDLDRLRRMLNGLAGRLLCGRRDRREQLDELVNEGVLAALEAMPRYDPSRSAPRTFAYRTATHAVLRWLRASRAGLSPAEHNRRNVGSRRGVRYPETLRGVDLDALHGPADGADDVRPSVRRAAMLLALASPRDRLTFTTYLAEDGNAAAASRRLSASHAVVSDAARRLRKIVADVQTLDAMSKEPPPCP